VFDAASSPEILPSFLLLFELSPAFFFSKLSFLFMLSGFLGIALLPLLAKASPLVAPMAPPGVGLCMPFGICYFCIIMNFYLFLLISLAKLLV
jgi:hypothetical protein